VGRRSAVQNPIDWTLDSGTRWRRCSNKAFAVQNRFQGACHSSLNTNRLALRVTGGICSAWYSWWNVAQLPETQSEPVARHELLVQRISKVDIACKRILRRMSGYPGLACQPPQTNLHCDSLQISNRVKSSAIPACNVAWMSVHFQRRR
jgi:hypothetical protein